MFKPPVRPVVAAVLLTVLVAGCDSASDGAAGNPPGSTAPVTTAPATASTPTPKPADLSALSANAILARTKASTLAAGSVRVRGVITEGGTVTKVDLQLTKTGGQGVFSAGGAPMTVRVIGKTIYLQMTEALIRATAKEEKSSRAETEAMLKLMKGKWLKSTKVEEGSRAIVELTTRDLFFKSLFAEIAKLRKSVTRTVDGVPSIGLTDGGQTLWVDVRNGRPVRLESEEAGSNDYLAFGDYDRLKAPKAPPARDVIDSDALGS